ncbi:MAG TPA: HAD family hydrolase [Lachnospiraceae bacterium]|nr:HAD family hydrolase [Lachnospiraceae bacterium]
MYKGVIFDLDGTIADTLESIAYSANLTLEKCGYMKRPVNEYRYYAGDGADVLIQRALIAAGDVTCSSYQQAMQYYKGIFEENCMYQVRPFDTMVDTLDNLKKHGIKIGVLTNKPHGRAITVVETVFGKDYFDMVLGQQEGIAKKPDPEGAILMLKEFNIEPSECVYVGDTNVDMETGKNTGMYTVGVLWGFRDRKELEDNHADEIIEQPQDLLRILSIML